MIREPSLGLPVAMVADVKPPGGAFPLVEEGGATPLWYDATDYPGVIRAVGDLRADIERVTSQKPSATSTCLKLPELVIIGTIGKSAAIDALVASSKLDASDLKGKWESFVVTTIAQPLPGVK